VWWRVLEFLVQVAFGVLLVYLSLVGCDISLLYFAQPLVIETVAMVFVRQ